MDPATIKLLTAQGKMPDRKEGRKMREEEKLPWGAFDTIGKLHDRIYTLETELARTLAALEGLKRDKKILEAAWAFYRHTTKGPHIVCEYEAFERGWALALTAALDRVERVEKGEES